MKTMTVLAFAATMLSLAAPAMAMGNKPVVSSSGQTGSGQTVGQKAAAVGEAAVNMVNEIGNNDAAQQAGGDIGEGLAKAGQALTNDGWNRHLNQGMTEGNLKNITDTGRQMFVGGKALEYGSKAAPHVGGLSTAAGYFAEGQNKGAAIQAVNGVGRGAALSYIGSAAGTAGGAWAAGKLGALAGSWAGPLGTGAGFIIGIGAAYLGGKIWDKTIGAGADALTQKAADWDAQSQYANDPNPDRVTGGGGGASWGEEGALGDDMPITTGVASETRDISRDNVQQQARDTIRISRPSGGGGGSGGDCGRH